MKVISIGILSMFITGTIIGATKIIPVPHIVGSVNQGADHLVELLELNDAEALTTSTFAELIQEKETSEFVLARVITQGPQGHNVHYFDANSLNRLYGPYPFTMSRQPFTILNPINQVPILSIQYFYISFMNSPSFTYLCSDYQILIEAHGNVYKDILYENQISNKQLQKDSEDRVSQHVLNNPDKFSPELVMQARMRAVNMYLDQNKSDEAFAILQQIIASPVVDIFNMARSHLAVGRMYIDFKKDYERAVFHLKQAITMGNTVDRIAAKRMIGAAQEHLGDIYAIGGHGINKDVLRAENCYKEALRYTTEDKKQAILEKLEKLDPAAIAEQVAEQLSQASVERWSEKSPKRQKMDDE